MLICGHCALPVEGGKGRRRNPSRFTPPRKTTSDIYDTCLHVGPRTTLSRQDAFLYSLARSPPPLFSLSLFPALTPETRISAPCVAGFGLRSPCRVQASLGGGNLALYCGGTTTTTPPHAYLPHLTLTFLNVLPLLVVYFRSWPGAGHRL